MFFDFAKFADLLKNHLRNFWFCWILHNWLLQIVRDEDLPPSKESWTERLHKWWCHRLDGSLWSVIVYLTWTAAMLLLVGQKIIRITLKVVIWLIWTAMWLPYAILASIQLWQPKQA